jgi:hypothetical protein
MCKCTHNISISGKKFQTGKYSIYFQVFTNSKKEQGGRDLGILASSFVKLN